MFCLPWKPPKKKNTRWIGIDLGTTKFCVSVLDNGVWKSVLNQEGNPSTLSVVSFINDTRKIGDPDSTDAQNVVFGIKRILGTYRSDAIIQKYENYWPYEIAEKHIRTRIRISTKSTTNDIYPEHIYAMLIVDAMDAAANYFGDDEPVTSAVISIPCCFNQVQQQCTINAAKIAGLKNIEIITDSMATAHAYSIRNDTKKTAIIIDIGGGSTQVSLVLIDCGSFKILRSFGSSHLGGEDFTKALFDHVVGNIEQLQGRKLPNKAAVKEDLRNICEEAKKQLSYTRNTSVIYDLLGFRTVISRDTFEELCDPLFTSITDILSRVIAYANEKLISIEEAVILGGSMVMPKIQRVIESLLPRIPLNKSMPEETSANGAAIHFMKIQLENHPRTMLSNEQITIGPGLSQSNNRLQTRRGLSNIELGNLRQIEKRHRIMKAAFSSPGKNQKPRSQERTKKTPKIEMNESNAASVPSSSRVSSPKENMIYQPATVNNIKAAERSGQVSYAGTNTKTTVPRGDLYSQEQFRSNVRYSNDDGVPPRPPINSGTATIYRNDLDVTMNPPTEYAAVVGNSMRLPRVISQTNNTTYDDIEAGYDINRTTYREKLLGTLEYGHNQTLSRMY